MYETKFQAWEAHESLSSDQSPFEIREPRSARTEPELESSASENEGPFESAFLTEAESEAGQAEAETFAWRSSPDVSPKRQGDCGCGGNAKQAGAGSISEAPAYASEAPSYEGLLTQVFPAEAFSSEALSIDTVSGETLAWGESLAVPELAVPETEGLEEAEWETSRCTAGCPEPTAAERSRIRAKGAPEGAFIERTAGDRTANFALQLFDYDVNEYRPLKSQHREALTRLREFIVNRLAQTNQPVAVTISGLASRTGSKAYNDVLSCKRAECVAENLRTALSFFRGAASRVQINTLGEGFTRATCKGADCELGEWRSVLVQVHAPGNPPRPVPPVDPGWDKYDIRCCSFHTATLVEAALEELLNRALPGVPAGLRGKLGGLIKKGVDRLKKELLKRLPKIAGAAEGLSEVLKLFPAEIIRETGVFEIRERDKPGARSATLCYSGFGLRIALPRKKLDDFLDETIGKVPMFKVLPPAARKEIRDAIKKAIPDPLKTLVQPIGSDTPGRFARFDLLHPRNIRVFSGSVQMGKGVWMPGQVNVEFNSSPWNRPDPIERPRITKCPDTDCNAAGVQTVVGDGKGLELFSITAGDLVAGSCACSPELRKELEAETEIRTQFWTAPESGTGESNEAETWESAPAEAERSLWEAESQEAESQEAQRQEGELQETESQERADAPLHEAAFSAGATPAAVTLSEMLSSAEMQQAAMASVLGHSAQRTVRYGGANMTIPAYLRLVSDVSREVAEQAEAEAEQGAGTGSKARGVIKYPADVRNMYYTFFQAAIQGVAAKSRLTARQKADLAERIADAAMNVFRVHGDRIKRAMNAASSSADRTSLNLALNLSGPWGEFFKGALSATAGADYDPKSPEKPVLEAAAIADAALLTAGQLDERLWALFGRS